MLVRSLPNPLINPSRPVEGLFSHCSVHINHLVFKLEPLGQSVYCDLDY